MSAAVFRVDARRKRLRGFLAFFALIVAGNAWLGRHPPAALVVPGSDAPEWPILIDLLLVAPLVYLVLFCREGHKAWLKAAAIALAGISIAGWIVPEANQHLLASLRQLRNALAALALGGEILLAAVLARAVIRVLGERSDPEHAVSRVLRERFGDTPVARLLAFEVRMWFWALFGSARRELRFAGDAHFGTHRKDGHASNQQGFLLLIGAEIPLVHGLLAVFWSHAAACAVTALSLWGFVFLLGEYRASLRRPISISDSALHIRYGLGAELVVPLQRIAEVARHGSHVPRRRAGVLRYCEAGAPNVRLELSPPLQVAGVFGGERPIERIYLGVDDVGAFLAAIQHRCQALSKASRND